MNLTIIPPISLGGNAVKVGEVDIRYFLNGWISSEKRMREAADVLRRCQ